VGRLHLRAETLEDVAALSALTQDFVTRSADIGYDRRGRRLVLLGNRFCWEQPAPVRVRSALVVSSLTAVRRRDWPDGDAVLELLAIAAEEWDAGARLTLHFAGGPAIRVEAECVDLLLDDLKGERPAAAVPRHEP
jgi:hypothetical protein